MFKKLVNYIWNKEYDVFRNVCRSWLAAVAVALVGSLIFQAVMYPAYALPIIGWILFGLALLFTVIKPLVTTCNHL
jgi:hypothetical protein